MRFFGEKNVVLDRIEEKGTIEHSNGRIMKLYICRIQKFERGKRSNFDDADYIAFEVPGIFTNGMTEEILRQYQMESRGIPSAKNRYYLGMMEREGNRYVINGRSQAVDKKVKQIVDKEIEDRLEEQRRRIEEDERERQERRIKEQKKREFRNRIDARKYEDRILKMQEKRLQFPTLRKAKSYNNGRENYDGVDLAMGNVLRIRNVCKVGKDKNGTYLYSAVLDTTLNESDVEILSGEDLIGKAVCFELPGRLDEIVEKGDPREIESILTILTMGVHYGKPRILNYIGEMKRNGEIRVSEGTKEIQSRSPAIQTKIEMMKKEYAEKQAKMR